MIGMDGKRLARRGRRRRAGATSTDDETEAIDRAAGEAFDRLNRVAAAARRAPERSWATSSELGIPWVIATSSRPEQVRALGGRARAAGRSRRSSTARRSSTPSRRRTCCSWPRSGSGVPPAWCWAVGDSTWDIRAARAAGMAAIAVTVGSAVGGDALREAGASLVVGTLDDLRATLERARRGLGARPAAPRRGSRAPTPPTCASSRVQRDGPVGRARARAEAARVHGDRQLVGVADRAHEQPDQEARMPLPEAAQPARAPERPEVLGESRHGLVRGEGAVGEARRDARRAGRASRSGASRPWSGRTPRRR